MLVGPETTPDYTKGGVPKEMMKGDMVRAFVTGNPLVEICTAMENAPAHAVSLAGEGYKTVLVEHEPIPPYDRPLSRHLEEMPISKAQLIGSSIVTATPKELKAAFETQKFDQGRLTDLIFAKSGLETTVPFGRYGLAAVDIGASILMGMSIPYLIDGTFKMFGVYAHRDPAAYATGAGANLLVMQGMSSISKAALDTGLSEAASKGAYFAARSGNGMVFSRHQMTSFFEGAKGNILNIVSMFTAMPTVVAGNLAGRTVGLDPKLYEGMSLAAGFGLQTLVSLCGKRAMGMFTSVMAPTGVVLFFEGVGMSWYEHEVAGDRSQLDIYFREKAKADLNAFELFGYELGFYTLILPSGVLALMDGDVEDTPSARLSSKMEMEISANETRLKNDINEWPLQMQLYGALLRGSDEDLLRITKNEDFGYSCLKSVIKYLEERGEYAILKRLVKNNDVYKEVMKALSWIPSVQGISLSYQIGDDGQGDAQMLTETKLLWSFIFSMAAGDFQDSLEFASNIPLRADGRLANGADILERWNYAKDVLLKMGINELDLQEQIALGRIRPNTRFKSNITPADFAVSYRSALR
jgi:hypothetical protein